MTTFVLVHDGWAVGWQWREVAAVLRIAGHEVFTPTLTGLGERVHLASPDVGLDTHIQDILIVLEYEDLHDVILVGYSYSAMVITGVAERAPERLAPLVYLGAYVPSDGESLLNMLGPGVAAFIEQAAQAYGDGWRIPRDPPDAPQRTSHPLKTEQQPVMLTNPAAAALPRTFSYCTQDNEAMGPPGTPDPISGGAIASCRRGTVRWRLRRANWQMSCWNWHE